VLSTVSGPRAVSRDPATPRRQNRLRTMKSMAAIDRRGGGIGARVAERDGGEAVGSWTANGTRGRWS
jgi:hypothetical protein